MKKRWFYYLFAATMCLAFFSLGRWQLARAEWKQHRLDAVAAVLKDRKLESLSLLSKESKSEDQLELAWVSGRGYFPDLPALLLDNQRFGEKVGVNVYRVFQPENGKALLVNLGWLEVPGNRTMPDIKKINGTQELNGLLVSPPSPGLAIGPAYVKSGKEYWLMTRIPLDGLAHDLKTPLAPRVLRLNPDLPIGYARDLDILPNTLPPEKHRGYAVQWFGLCIATIVLTLVLGLRNKEKKND